MTITLIYLRIARRVEPTLPLTFPYEIAESRFIDTYTRYKPVIPHQLLVVNCGGPAPANDPFQSIATAFDRYDGFGSDCGTYQAIGSKQQCDLVLCLNTIAYLWRPNWMEPFARAAEKYGKGVYGATASFECCPHLRTPCIGFHPDVMRQYPYPIDTRRKAVFFESSATEMNFTQWAIRSGYPTLLVTEQGEYAQAEWRKPPNIFRRGDQTNCLVWDRHTDLYANASNHEKALLAKAADGL